MKVKSFKIPSYFWLHSRTQKRNLVLLLLLLLIVEMWQLENQKNTFFSHLAISFSQILKFSQKKV